jgi:hypothetical protein
MLIKGQSGWGWRGLKASWPSSLRALTANPAMIQLAQKGTHPLQDWLTSQPFSLRSPSRFIFIFNKAASPSLPKFSSGFAGSFCKEV